MPIATSPALTLTLRGQIVDLTPHELVELAALEAIQRDVVRDGVWLGKTAALLTADDANPPDPVPGTTQYADALLVAYTAGDNLYRRGPDGLPLAWSCWDIALTLVRAIRRDGRFTAWLLDATGTETGARSEPHALVGIRAQETGNRYLADPYFEVLPVVHRDALTGRREGLTCTATLTGRTSIPARADEWSVAHVAYGGQYSFEVADHLPLDRESELLAAAPGWAWVRDQRVARTRCGNLTIRVADTDTRAATVAGTGAVQIKIWDHTAGPGRPADRRATYPTWHQAMSHGDSLVQAHITTLAALDATWAR